jgi:hypothetical protein
MYCSGKTRDGGTCSRRARFGLFCKTHLPLTSLEDIENKEPVPVKDFLGIMHAPPPFVVSNEASSEIVLNELDAELPTLYSYVLEMVERERKLIKQLHVPKTKFDKTNIGTSVNQLYKLGFRVMENRKNVLVYRPRFENAASKAAWRAKHARLHDDRLDVLGRIEEGTRIRVRDSFKVNYEHGFLNGALYTCVLSGLLGFAVWAYRVD